MGGIEEPNPEGTVGRDLCEKVPLGTIESSPALQCRVIGIGSESVPLGTVEIASAKVWFYDPEGIKAR
jgi:hypothetical protein